MLKNLLFQKNRHEVLEDGYKILNKTKELVQKDVAIITKWLKTQKHLPEITNSDIIENFLKLNKFSIELTKQKIDMYYSIRKIVPEIYINTNPLSPHMQEFSKVMYCIPLPKLTNDLNRVVVMKLRDIDPDKFHIYYALAYSFNVAEIRLWEDAYISNIIIIDFTGLSLKHVMKCTPVSLKKASAVVEKVHGNRINKFHTINCPVAESIITLIKKVLNPKLRDRFVNHKDSSTLKDYIPCEILPKDFGGEELSLEELHCLWQLKFEEYKDRFDQLDKMEVNEALRPIPLSNNEILGFHGNFKKLDVD